MESSANKVKLMQQTHNISQQQQRVESSRVESSRIEKKMIKGKELEDGGSVAHNGTA